MKKSKALVKVPLPESFGSWERQISAEFENGGGVHFITRGDSIGGCLANILDVIKGMELEPGYVLSLQLRYWQLDEDLTDFAIQVSATDSNCEDRKDPLQTICRQLAARVKVRFVAMLAKQGITLYGLSGSLEGGAK